MSAITLSVLRASAPKGGSRSGAEVASGENRLAQAFSLGIPAL